MVIFIIKWTIAAIPAFIFLYLILAVFYLFAIPLIRGTLEPG